MNMCRKETNNWKENKERDLCCENKEGNFIKMEFLLRKVNTDLNTLTIN